MLRARRAFLNAQHFRPVAQAVSDVINTHSHGADTPGQPRRLLDIGCGEGYYLRQLRESLHGDWLTAGLDIAKEGVQLAAKSDKQSTWVCASSARIPLLEQSLDVLLRIFAPSAAEQTQRVLAHNGLLVTVAPAGPHLLEIKQALYATATLHQEPVAPAGFVCVDEQQVSYTLALREQEHIQALLSMTPFFWRGNKDAREQLLQRHSLDVCIAVWVSCYRKANPAL